MRGIKKNMVMYVLFVCVCLIFTSCGTAKSEENIRGFLTEFYEVKNTEDYEDFFKTSQEIIEKNASLEQSVGELDSQLYEPFYKKYESYCSKKALQLMAQSGYLMKYDKLAWEETCEIIIKDITIEKDKVEKQYSYTLKLEKHYADGTKESEEGSGLLQLNKENQIDWFKITTPA